MLFDSIRQAYLDFEDSRNESLSRNEVSIADKISGWDSKELANLGRILGLEEDNIDVGAIEQAFKWRYRCGILMKVNVGSLLDFEKMYFRNHEESLALFKKITGKRIRQVKDGFWDVPKYDTLILCVAKHLKVYERAASLEKHELHIAQSVIISSLHNLKPSEREKYFQQIIPIEQVIKDTNIDSSVVKGPATLMALLGTANIVGFDLYLTATTALGFITNSLGITLPFAAYLGLSTILSYVVNPITLVPASIWLVWALNQPRWKYILPALLCIISTNSKRSIAVAT
jgi:hypothetical protein